MEQHLVFIGLVGMIDPPRLEVKDSIKLAKQAGIKVVMITGDHKNTAFAIAKELGIAESLEQCMTGQEFDLLTEEERVQKVNQLSVFARVSPNNKVEIVKAFKANDNIVSMTGDGVNDAPSLKAADIGVAMGITGTDVSKGASDMILTDDNFSTIVEAIEEGRNIYNNIKKAVIFLLSCNLGEIVAIFLAVLLGWPVPLLATQILWINLITDTLPAISLGIDPGDKGVMLEKPRSKKESFFAHGATSRAVTGGLLIGLTTLLAFVIGLLEQGVTFANISSVSHGDEAFIYASTMAFVVLAVSQLFYSFTMRNEKKSILQVGIFSNTKLVGSLVIGVLLQLIVIGVPFLQNAFGVTMLEFADFIYVFGLALIPVLINELLKLVTYLKNKN
jgi:Ca2+-transporting ATPase